VQEVAYLAEQNSAHEGAQEAAHLNTGNVESDNRNQGAVSAGQPFGVASAKRNTRQSRNRRTLLSEDWQSSETNLSFAIQHGLSVDAAHREVLKFKNYYISKGTLMLD
jgi:hypothetical protein